MLIGFLLIIAAFIIGVSICITYYIVERHKQLEGLALLFITIICLICWYAGILSAWIALKGVHIV